MLCILIRGDSNENTQHTIYIRENRKYISIMPPVVAL